MKMKITSLAETTEMLERMIENIIVTVVIRASRF
jgi:hypothetical protein